MSSNNNSMFSTFSKQATTYAQQNPAQVKSMANQAMEQGKKFWGGSSTQTPAEQTAAGGGLAPATNAPLDAAGPAVSATSSSDSVESSGAPSQGMNPEHPVV